MFVEADSLVFVGGMSRMLGLCAELIGFSVVSHLLGSVGEVLMQLS